MVLLQVSWLVTSCQYFSACCVLCLIRSLWLPDARLQRQSGCVDVVPPPMILQSASQELSLSCVSSPRTLFYTSVAGQWQVSPSISKRLRIRAESDVTFFSSGLAEPRNLLPYLSSSSFLRNTKIAEITYRTF